MKKTPSFHSADDFVIPSPPKEKNDEERARSLYDYIVFKINTFRVFVDHDPYSITYELMYHDSSLDGPSRRPFFKKTIELTKTNLGGWLNKNKLNKPTTLSIYLRKGDLDDNGETIFHFTNKSFLPFDKTLWFTFYATGPRNFNTSTLQENNVYWITLNNKTGSTPLVNPLHKSIPNYNYHYRDTNNLFKYPDEPYWIDAKRLQTLLYLPTKTYNMAWSVSIRKRKEGEEEL